MPLSFIITILIGNMLTFSLGQWLIEESHPLQIFCLNRSQSLTEFRAPVLAMICGHRHPQDFSFFQTLSQFGVIHLFVVSGAHLVFLERLLSITKLHRLTVFILGLYTGLCGANLPILRAFFSFLIAPKINRYHRSFQILLPCLLCLLLFPQAFHGLSLPLSWCAILALQVPIKNLFLKSFIIYLFIAPLLLSLGLPHPFSIFSQILLTPFIAIILFPLCIFIWIFPGLESYFIPIWKSFEWTLTFGTKFFPSPIEKINLWSSQLNILYCLVLHFIFWRVSIYLRRKSCSKIDA